MIAIYVLFVVLLHVPAVQHNIASKSAEIISEKLGTKVEIGGVSLGLLNRVILDDVVIEDQKHQKMMSCHRLSTKISIISLLNGRIDISSAQIFGMNAILTQADANAPVNCQFVLDSLASKDTTSHTPLDLHIASLIIRNTNISYDRLDKPKKPGVFDTHHLSFEKISSHIMLYELTDDSLSVRTKKIAFTEKNSGLSVSRLSFIANAGKRSARLKDFSLVTKSSDISLDADLAFRQKVISKFNISSNLTSVSTNDIGFFVPQLKKLNKTFFIDADVYGTDKSMDVRRLSISSSGRKLSISARGAVKSDQYILDCISKPETMNWTADINTLRVSQDLLSELLSSFNVNAPVITKFGNINYSAKASGNKGDIIAKGNIETSAGSIEHDIKYTNKHLDAKLTTGTINLGNFLSSDAFGDIQTEIHTSADIIDTKSLTIGNAQFKLLAPLLTIKGYPYRNVVVSAEKKGGYAEANLEIADLNINTKLDVTANNINALFAGHPEDIKDLLVHADIQNIVPNSLGFLKGFASTSFSGDIKANVNNLSNPLDNLNFDINDFVMQSPSKQTRIDNLSIDSETKPGRMRNVSITSDFAEIHANGCFDFATLQNSLFNLVRQKLPTLPGMPQYQRSNNNIQLSARVEDTSILRDLLGIELYIHDPIVIDGFINDATANADVSMSSNSITLSGTTLDDTNLHLFTQNDTLNIATATSRRDDDGGHLALRLNGKAANNKLSTTISMNSGRENGFTGVLNASSRFYNNLEGASTAHISITPSEMSIGDTLWHIHPSDIIYSANQLKVNNFLIEHGSQHIRIDGQATKSSKDSLVVNLQDVNVAYILNLVNFHSVEFSGYATGNAVVKSLFSKPDAYTDLSVKDFHFENGRLGTLDVHGQWDDALGQINVAGRCSDPDVVPSGTAKEAYVAAAADIFDDDDNETRDGRTDVNGYISIKKNYIDLDIKARNTRLEFMHTYCDSFMDNIVAWGSGHVRIWGDLSKINLTGDAVANGSILIKSLNTTYTLLNDSVHFIPNDMLIKHAVFYDKNGNQGTISGALHHRYLSRMTFDLDVKASHLLCFDFPTLDGETFCGHVIGTGQCKITGRPGQVTFDIEAYPEETSEFTYNVSSPDALQNQEFIQWRDAGMITDKDENGIVFADNNICQSDDTPQPGNDQNELDEPDEDFHTNIYLNFLIHATPASTLKLIMDERTGDVITFHGNGTLRANYYNKGGMQLFGNYNVEGGEYKMTIQQVITKNFEFLPGGSLSFGGDPFEAGINLQAQYVVPSVPLSDLNIGNSFSNNTVRVNCLMNITGTAGQPQVEFDLNLPQASTDIQQMITSLMDGEEERNQQVLYLLSVGRFYNATNNASEVGQSKASIAMQSFLSGTLSQQLNNIISNNILKNQNWNFGTNISPGDEGMNNAEYEGLFSGRMLNNRLLINGQFGYRDNANATTSFIGDFDVRYLLFLNGNLQVRVYNQTSDRYFTKSNLNTQGLGIIFKHDFNSFIPYFLRKKTTKKQ